MNRFTLLVLLLVVDDVLYIHLLFYTEMNRFTLLVLLLAVDDVADIRLLILHWDE